MADDFGGLGFAGALAQSRSVQGLVRTLNLFGEKYNGACSFTLERSSAEGVEVNFGTTNEAAAERGLDDLIQLLSMTEELMLLQAMIANLQDRRADPLLVEALVEDAHALINKLYPGIEIVDEKNV